MRVYVGIVFVIMGLVVILATRNSKQLAEGQAGRAYVKNEDGEFELATGERAASRIEPPARPDDGSSDEWLKRFALTERSGAVMGSEELKGQPYVAGFFFSTCPSICVQQNGKVKELQDQFQGQPIRFVSISCDPEVDNPQVLSDYAERFEADPEQWLFFTGDMDYIRRVGSEFFSLGVMRRGHPEKFALMDAEGKPFGLYTWSDENQWQALEEDIERLLEAGGVLADAGPAEGADGVDQAAEVGKQADLDGEATP